jgi:hypothetical protein
MLNDAVDEEEFAFQSNNIIHNKSLSLDDMEQLPKGSEARMLEEMFTIK